MFDHLIEAAKIVDKLQAWIEERDGLSEIQVASLTYCGNSGYTSISVGEQCVYDDNVHCSETELNFEFCRDEYLRYIDSLSPFFSDLPTIRPIES